MLYCQDANFVTRDAIAGAALLPDVEVQKDPETGRRFVELRLGPTVHIVLVLVDGEELQGQLQGLITHLSTECELTDPTLPSQLAQVGGAVEVDMEHSEREAARCERFMRRLAKEGRAFIYREDGSLEDADGQKLAVPKGAS